MFFLFCDFKQRESWRKTGFIKRDAKRKRRPMNHFFLNYTDDNRRKFRKKPSGIVLKVKRKSSNTKMFGFSTLGWCGRVKFRIFKMLLH